VTDLESFLASFDGEPGYLDWASFGPLSPSVREDSQADTELLGSGRSSSIDLVSEHVTEARSLVAELIGTDAAQVVRQPSTTYGLMQALYGLSGGILVARSEFPSLTVTATRAFQARGALEPQWFDPEGGFVSPDAVRESLTDDTRAVAVSLVDSKTGYRADLTALREVIGDRLLIVDAIQAFGAIDADYPAADVVCANGYKWLRAGRGTGFAWFSERALERIAPVLSNQEGIEGEIPPDSVPVPAASAQAFTVSAPDHLAASRLATALRDVRDVGIDVVEAELTDRADAVIRVADRYGVPVLTPRQPEHRAGIVTLAPLPADTAPLAASLANHGLTVTTRSDLVRVSPHVGAALDALPMLDDALAEFALRHTW
jgi:selenocysteine lyase/cysteine desulfurase